MNLEISKDERYRILIFKASVCITTAYTDIIKIYVPIRQFLKASGHSYIAYTIFHYRYILE